jgi:hypothetical protein
VILRFQARLIVKESGYRGEEKEKKEKNMQV